MEPEKWDFFDLDQEIHVAISEDGKVGQPCPITYNLIGINGLAPLTKS